MAKDHVFDDLVAQAHAAATLGDHVSPIARSRMLINTYMELLPQYLADNPDQLPDGPDPAKREEIITIKLPPMSNEGKARKEAREKDAKAAAVKQKAAEEAAKEAARAKAEGPPKAIRTEHGVLYKDPTPIMIGSADMARQSYEVNEEALRLAFDAMAVTSHPDQLTTMRNVVANYLSALRTLLEAAAAAEEADPPALRRAR